MRAQSNRKPAPLTKAVGDGYSGAERSVARIINQGWDIMDTGLMQDRAMQMLEASSTEGFLNALPWTQFAEHLGQTVEPISGAVGRAISEELGTIGHAGAKLSLTSVDALSHKYAQEQAGQLIRNISDSQRNTIRGILANAQAGNYTVDQAAREIRKGIGLHPAWAQAVTNYENRLSAQPAPKGYGPARWQQTIDKRVARYREQLIRKRSYNIARTEIITAENLGVYATWSQAIGSGAADVNSRKEWAPGPGACRICERLSGEIVGWDAPFSNGAMMPPAHPSCRCSANLLPPEYTTPGLNPRNINWTDPAGDRVAEEGFDAGAGRGILDGMSAEPAAADVADEFGYGGTSDGADTYGEDTSADETPSRTLDKTPKGAAAELRAIFAEDATQEQIDALKWYQKEFHQAASINTPLREGTALTAEAQRKLDAIQSLFAETPKLQNPIKLYRSLYQTPEGWGAPGEMAGKDVVDRGIMSTARDAATATRSTDNGVFMSITVPANTARVIPLEYVTGFNTDLKYGEHLLPPGTELHITKDFVDRYGVRTVQAEVRPIATTAEAQADQAVADTRATYEAQHPPISGKQAADAIDKDFVRGTEDEGQAAGLYLGGARYNAALRSGNAIDEYTQEYIDHLTNYIEKQPPLPEGTSLWRGMGGHFLPTDQVFVGAEINEPAFFSTSLSEHEALNFTGQGNGNVLMEIKPRAQDRGLSINHATAPDQSRVPEEYRQQFHSMDREAEMLLRPNTTIRVVESETRMVDGYEVRYIKGEIVDGAETPTIEIPAAAELPKMSAYERDLQAMQQAATATKADQLTYESTLHWSEDKLMAQITKYEDDPESIDKIFEIIDQRAAAEDAKLAAQEAAQASYNAAQAAKEAARIEEAAMREAGTLRTEESPALNPAVREERGLNAYHRAGEEFQHYMYSQYSKALDETNGNFFNAANHAAAKKRGYDEIALFSGPYRIAKKYASEELLRFWETEGRETLGSFRYKLLGRPSDRKAFDTVVREGLGRKAASYDRSNL